MAVVQAPHVRWGGRWASKLRQSLADGVLGSGWTELTEYKKTTGYQVARSLNLGAALPEPPEGKQFEFGFSETDDGNGSVLSVRLVDAKD